MNARAVLDADMQTIGRWLADGVRWWLEELAQLLPARWRGGAHRGVPRVGFRPDLAALEPSRTATAVVTVPTPYCLHRLVEQPVLPPRDLTSLLRLSADRLMPFAGDAVVVGRPIGPAGPGRMTVELAGMPHARAETLAAAIAASGIRPVAVAVESRHGGAPIDLLPELRARGLIPDRRGAARLWWTVVAAMVALNLAAVIWRDVAAVDRLQALVDEQQPALAAVRAIDSRMRRDRREAAQVVALRRTREPLAVLGRIGAALPPGAWVQRLTIDRGTVRLTGYRPASADVTRALRAAGLRDVRPSSGEEMAAVPAGQPFDLTARIGAP